MFNQEEKLQEWFPDHPEVIQLIETLAIISQTWDDLIDGDKPVSPVEVSEMVMGALFGVRNNNFFRLHEQQLNWALMRACRDWFEANSLEERNDVPLHTMTLRSGLTPVICELAYLAHPPGRAHEVACDVRRAIFDPLVESYEEYTQGLTQEPRLQEVK